MEDPEHDGPVTFVPETEDVNLASAEHSSPDQFLEPVTVIPKPRASRYVYLSAAMAAVGGILFGYDIGIISGAMLQLRDDFSLSCTQQEVIVSSLLAGAVVGSLCSGPLVDLIGRRISIIINSAIFVAGAALLSASNGYPLLIIGRLVLGFSISLSAVAECVYISEIAPSNIRGRLVSLNELGICTGILLAYIANFALISVQHGWRYMFALSSIPAIVQGVGMIFLPASPRYLLLRGKVEQALMVLRSLRDSDPEAELLEMKSALNDEQAMSFIDLFKIRDFMLGRLCIGIGLVLCQQLTGQPSLIYYAPTILQDVGFHSDTAATLATVGLGVVKLLALMLTLLAVDKAGRRRFLLIGVFIMALGLLALTIASSSDVKDMSCVDKDDAYSNITLVTGSPSPASATSTSRWVSLAGLMVYVAAYELSFGAISWLIPSEIFPAALKGRGMSLCIVFNWLGNLLVASTFLQLFSSIGVSATFGLYLGACLASFVFVLLFVPETRSKSLEQVDEQLKRSSVLERARLNLMNLCGTSSISVYHYQPLTTRPT